MIWPHQQQLVLSPSLRKEEVVILENEGPFFSLEAGLIVLSDMLITNYESGRPTRIRTEMTRFGGEHISHYMMDLYLAEEVGVEPMPN